MSVLSPSARTGRDARRPQRLIDTTFVFVPAGKGPFSRRIFLVAPDVGAQSTHACQVSMSNYCHLPSPWASLPAVGCYCKFNPLALGQIQNGADTTPLSARKGPVDPRGIRSAWIVVRQGSDDSAGVSATVPAETIARRVQLWSNNRVGGEGPQAHAAVGDSLPIIRGPSYAANCILKRTTCRMVIVNDLLCSHSRSLILCLARWLLFCRALLSIRDCMQPINPRSVLRSSPAPGRISPPSARGLPWRVPPERKGPTTLLMLEFGSNPHRQG